MKAVIMAGGFGTRLRPLTCNIPKPMVPVANRPIMQHIVQLLKKHNFKDVISILYFQPEQITDYFKDGKDFGIKMKYQNAQEDFGTAGSVKNTESLIGDSPFLVISGDVITDFNLTKAVKFHKDKKSLITIVLTRVKNPLEYGVVITDQKSRITKFLEKPSWGEVFSDTINTGIYIIEPEIMKHIPEKQEFDFSKNLFPTLMKNNIPIYGYIADGYWKDVGNITEYRKSHMDIL
ncbi:MAG: nucleotidyltransferase family protein, partial [bacterium]|nr:nucleotidyltransferase family protein [bacterium]